MRLWDPRAAPGQACVGAVPLPGKVYAVSAGQERLVVGTSGRQVLVFDIRRWVWVKRACGAVWYGVGAGAGAAGGGHLGAAGAGS